MENNHASHENIWHQQQQMPPNDQTKQYYGNHYQPMQHGFDLQRELVVQSATSSATAPNTNTPENVHFLRDNNGPYVKIYYSDNNKEYELFERNQLQQSENPIFMNNVDMFNNYLPNTQNQLPFPLQPPQQLINQQQQQQQQQPQNNSVIHHLVTSNLGPGKFEFGTFGGHNASNNAFSTTSSPPPLNISIPTLLDRVKTSSSSYNNIDNSDRASMNMSPISSAATAMRSPQLTSTTAANVVNNSNAPPYGGNNSNNNNSNSKKRIVAEVKPMRLSYSDVVSKNATNGQIPIVNNNNNNSSSSTGPSNSNSSSPNTTMPITTSKANKTKYQPSSAGGAIANNSSFERKYQENNDKNRKSPIIVNYNINNANSTNASSSEIKRNQTSGVKIEKPSLQPPLQNAGQVSSSKKNKSLTKDSLNVKSTANSNEMMKNKYATDSDDEEENDEDDDDDDDQSSIFDSENYDEERCTSDYYDIRKNVFQGEHHKIEKIKSSTHKKIKPTSASSGVAAVMLNSKKGERNQKRTVGKTSNRKPKHEFIQKLFASCAEYLYIFVKWLWMLIYDVGYLSGGIIWDRMSWSYNCGMQGVLYVRKELNGNLGKSFIAWIKGTWKKFDNRFDKKSKWAFWRWIFKKPSNIDYTKDYYKDGKLPKTAEEAMKSLLNCKEKDAYSILGVSADCPQEQIKKHYKKLAVLVHPDKNKQAGAEEAFKVLQRSFELIAEPESRKQYDENLVKALHTEKAFNELNDLLIQLQTKISEAANTIRCSSCCFRHPRKPTGRKAFAARECSTCKIRHAAREGDIWAETTFFGLRWKYLALMEGNVFDITEWALCQRGALSHLQANSCVVQYKIVLGGNQQNQSGDQKERDRFKKEAPVHEPQEDFFLNNIYAGQTPTTHQNAKRRYKKN